MAIITATPCLGVDKPITRFASTREISQDLPSPAIGECVAEAANNAWKSGLDISLDPFLIIVTFR
jgi:hypothetical protein